MESRVGVFRSTREGVRRDRTAQGRHPSVNTFGSKECVYHRGSGLLASAGDGRPYGRITNADVLGVTDSERFEGDVSLQEGWGRGRSGRCRPSTSGSPPVVTPNLSAAPVWTQRKTEAQGGPKRALDREFGRTDHLSGHARRVGSRLRWPHSHSHEHQDRDSRDPASTRERVRRGRSTDAPLDKIAFGSCRRS